MDHYTEFISLIHDFIDLFRSLTTVEQQKLDAAVANDLSILEDCMKKEQAFVLRLRGLEQQRDGTAGDRRRFYGGGILQNREGLPLSGNR